MSTRPRRAALLPAAVVLLAAACQGDRPGSAAAPDSAASPAADRHAAAPAAGPTLPTGRYVCYRLLSTGDEVAGDLYVDGPDRYRSLDAEGRFRFAPDTRLIEWESGPLRQPGEDWVGVFTPRGGPTGHPGGKAADDFIEIRRRADVEAGNAAAMQRCHLAG